MCFLWSIWHVLDQFIELCHLIHGSVLPCLVKVIHTLPLARGGVEINREIISILHSVFSVFSNAGAAA